jgi:hypothetical protein
MKRFFFVVNVAVFSLILTMSSAQADPVIIDTDKSMYNLDPYQWVYSASQYLYFGTNLNLWPAEGHDKTIKFTLEGYTAVEPPLTFSVTGLEGDPVEGTLTDDNGIYRGEFVVGEASVGGELFKPGVTDVVGTPLVPRVVTLTISDNAGTVAVADRAISISRWACDRCHVEKNVAKSIYSWSNPTGTSISGPHTWPNILGRNGGRPGFTYDNLTNDALTHTPTVGAWVPNNDGVLVWVPNPLDNPIGHEMTIVKGGGLPGCSPCHQGSGNVRHAYSGVEGMRFIVSRVRSLTVKCVFCHSADAGYIPEDLDTTRPHWENWIMQGWN